MYNTIIFDLDGTIVDSKEGILSSVKYIISFYKLKQLTGDELLTFIGPPIQESLKRVYGMNDNEAQICANTFRDNYKKEDVYKVEIYNGIVELLEYLKNSNYKLGIATYKREDYAKNLVKHIGLDKYFKVVCGADNDNKLTKADIIENCIKILNAQKDNSIMVGDSLSDAIASEKAKVDFIAVTYGFGFKPKEKNENFSKIFQAETPLEIKSFLQTITK